VAIGQALLILASEKARLSTVAEIPQDLLGVLSALRGEEPDFENPLSSTYRPLEEYQNR